MKSSKSICCSHSTRILKSKKFCNRIFSIDRKEIVQLAQKHSRILQIKGLRRRDTKIGN
ncbi:MAG: hypothetical protein ACI4FZ_01755 [Lachnospiraceae bacterium]